MVKTKHPIDLLAGYALSTLSESESAEVLAHLRTCTSCRKELAGYESTVTKLSLATPAQIAPTGIKQNLMKKVQQQSGNRLTAGPARWWQTIFAKPAYAAISLLAILALAVSNFFLWRELQQSQDTPTPVAQTINLENTGKVASGSAMLVISEDMLHATLIVEQLPQLTPEQQYQLWLIDDGQPASAGVFTVSRDGYFALPIISDQSLASFSAFGVSIEPFGGSPAPTGDIVLYTEKST